MDHVTVPASVRTAAGLDAVMLEVGLLDDWVVIASTETGGPSITVDECSWRRIVAAAEGLLASR